jgi:hypothetical protein
MSRLLAAIALVGSANDFGVSWPPYSLSRAATAMTSDDGAEKTLDVAAAPSVLPAGVRAQIFIYLGVLLVLIGLPGGLIGLPTAF